MSPFPRSFGLIAALATLGTLLPGVARAEPPPGSAFAILYYTTDENGERGRQMTTQDLTQFVNRARCECGQAIDARITLLPGMGGGGSYDGVPIRSFVGTNCAMAQTTINPQSRPCAKIIDAYTNAYTKSISVKFDPIWLASGIQAGTNDQTLGTAVPDKDCSTAQGDGGVWICIENGMQTECQADEFQVTGTQNINVPMGGMMMGLHFDFLPPQTLPTDFRTSSGDGAVQIEWDILSTGDVNGFRVLCADANGDPLPSKGTDGPSVTDINRGTMYWTQQTLCPDGPFGDVFGEGGGTTGEDGTTGTSTSTSTTTDGGTGDGGTTGGIDFEDPVWHGGVPATESGSGSDSATGSGSDSATGSEGGSGSGSATGGEPLPSEGILSLDWSYVCSDHKPFNTDSVRIDGLENEEEYQFVVVAYDLAGNPVAASGVLTATPRETNDLWEQCADQGYICGEGGYCNCTTDPQREHDGRLALIALVALGAAVRRRRRTR
jgi:hypothetical protein